MQDIQMNNTYINRPIGSLVRPCRAILVLVIGNMLSYAREIPVIVKLRAASNKIAGQIYP